jgi:hypothetical protein
MLEERDQAPGWKPLCITMGVVYVLLALSMLVRGVGIMTGFGTPDELVRSPVFADFFSFFYELMALVGVLIALLGITTQGRALQQKIASVLCSVNLALAARDLSTADWAFGSRLYRGPGTLAPVAISLVFALAYAWVALARPARSLSAFAAAVASGSFRSRPRPRR